MALGNNGAGVVVSAPFQSIVSQPIDTRFSVKSIVERDAIETKYDGLITYVQEESTYYRYNESNDSWSIAITVLHSVDGFPSLSIGNVGDWALNDKGALYHKEKRSDSTVEWVSKAIMGNGGSGNDGVGTVNIGVSFTSIDSMNNNIGKYTEGTVAILNLDINDEQNGTLYRKTLTDNAWEWVYLGKITGPSGINGKAATLTIGTITTTEPGTEATVVNVGTETEAVLNISIPSGQRGLNGEKGEKGDRGEQGLPTIINGIAPVDESINLTLDNIPDGEVRKLGITVQDLTV